MMWKILVWKERVATFTSEQATPVRMPPENHTLKTNPIYFDKERRTS